MRFLLLTCLLILSKNLYTQPSDCPYPIIFLHGWTGNENSFSAVYNHDAFENIWGPRSDVFHAVINATTQTHIWGNDGIKGTTDDDVLVEFNNLSNDLAPGCIYAINFDNFWNENQGNPQIEIHNGDSPSSSTSDSNESAILKQGYALGQMIKKVLEANPDKEKVVVVAFSMGGLEAREYLQRRTPETPSGTPRWWVDPGNSNGHKVAKLVSLSTPHRGSNAFGNISGIQGHPDQGRDGLPDLTSEAVRDLRYSIGCGFLNLFDCPGVYLFGGDEDDIGTWFYSNADVDCDGDESSNPVTGINVDGTTLGLDEPWHGTYDNPSIPLPTDIRYTWITSDIPGNNGDGVVALDRQWIFNGNTPMPSDGTPFQLSDSLFTTYFHTNTTGDVNTIIRGMDEGDYPHFAWDVMMEREYAGIPQLRSVNAPEGPNTTDPDWYKFTVPAGVSDGLEIILSPNSSLSGRIDFFTSQPSAYARMNSSGVHFFDFPAGSGSISLLIPPGAISPGNTYYFRIIHHNVRKNSWQSPFRFTIGPAAPLPLELLTFKGHEKSGSVLLDWTTVNERNTDRFELERSADGIRFKVIGEVAASGSSIPQKEYAFEDSHPLIGDNYYRLKMIDKNETFEYSPQIAVRMAIQKFEINEIYPNPATTSVKVHFNSASSQNISVRLLSMVGQEVYRHTIQPLIGSNILELNTSELETGLYILEMKQGDSILKARIAVN